MDEVSVEAKRDFASGEFGADFQAMLGQLGVAVDIDEAINFDHGRRREAAGAGHRCCGWRRSGRARAAHAQDRGGLQRSRLEGTVLTSVTVDEDMDGVLVDPNVRALASRGWGPG